MSPDQRDLILGKLARLDEYLEYLNQLKKLPRRRFENDFTVIGAVERYLQLSIGVVLDVGKLSLIFFEAPRPENNHEIFELLVKKRIITKAIFNRLKGMAGFRNILVHDYMKIDRIKVYEILQTHLKDLKAFRQAIVRKLK